MSKLHQIRRDTRVELDASSSTNGCPPYAVGSAVTPEAPNDRVRGFVAVPRWWRMSPEWRSLKYLHRGIIDELYHSIARKAVTHNATGIRLERGQWVISYESLGERGGASEKEVRTAIAHAVKFGWIGREVRTIRRPGGTLHITIFTWLSFDSYDNPESGMGGSPGESPGGSVAGSAGEPSGEVIPELNTPIEDPSENTNTRACCESEPSALFAGDLPTTPSAPEKRKSKSRDRLELPALPTSLDTPEMREAWEDYAQHRREIGKTLTPTATAKQLAQLERWGVHRAIKAIEHSIANRWQGIFEEKDTRDGRSRPNGGNRGRDAERRDNAEVKDTVHDRYAAA